MLAAVDVAGEPFAAEQQPAVCEELKAAEELALLQLDGQARAAPWALARSAHPLIQTLREASTVPLLFSIAAWMQVLKMQWLCLCNVYLHITIHALLV